MATPLRFSRLVLLLGALCCAGVAGASVSPPPPPSSSSVVDVHVWCHSHDDVGWLKTVDQYFSGGQNVFQHAGVRWVLDSILDQLSLHPTYKFNFVEQAFFQMWYLRLPTEQQVRVQKLVAAGQLNFINGGMVMHDEGAPTYSDMIEQTTLGHKFLKDEFDFTPTAGWQIDPFGHSSAQASLLSAAVGIQSIFYARIDNQEHDWRMKNRDLEFVWRTSPSLGAEAQVWAGASQTGDYGPEGREFKFDINQETEPVVADKSLDTYNVDTLVDLITEKLTAALAANKGRVLNWYAGGDFNYESAREWYANMDVLMAAVNARGQFNLFYSTPDAYTLAVHAQNLTYSVKTDDHFPYGWFSPESHTYWTGYFTSRPALKRQVREASGLLHDARQFEVFASLSSSLSSPPRDDGSSGSHSLWTQLSIAQHHDAVSGTSRQHVTNDYAKRLAEGSNQARTMMQQVLAAWTDGASAQPLEFGWCTQVNISVCPYTQFRGSSGDLMKEMSSHHRPSIHLLDESSGEANSDDASDFATLLSSTQHAVAVVVYNPLLRVRDVTLTLPLSLTAAPSDYQLVDSTTLQPITSQIEGVVCSPATCSVSDTAWNNLRAIVTLQPLEWKTFFLVLTQAKNDHTAIDRKAAGVSSPAAPVTFDLSNEELVASFVDGHLVSLTDLNSGETRKVTHQLMYYESFALSSTEEVPTGELTMEYRSRTHKQYNRETNRFEQLESGPGLKQQSGAYIFRPVPGQDALPILPPGETLNYTLVRGQLFDSVIHYLSPWANLTYRLWHTGSSADAALELDMQIGSIPIEDNIGKEIISRWDTELLTMGMWTADSNGRDMVQRTRNKRSWPFIVSEPIASNYVPVTGAAAIRDQSGSATDMQLTVLVDRAEGCSSLTDGALEVMVHRRILADDLQGVLEPLNETAQAWYEPSARPKGCPQPPPTIFRDGLGLGQVIQHRIVFAAASQSAANWRPRMHAATIPAVVAFADVAGGDISVYQSSYALNASFASDQLLASGGLPAGVELLTLQLWDHLNTTTRRAAAAATAAGAPHLSSPDASSVTLLLRLTHLFGIGEDATSSRPIDVDLSQLFRSNIRLSSVQELSLTANALLTDVAASRLEWRTAEGNTNANQHSSQSADWPSLFESTLRCAAPRCSVPTLTTIAPLQVRTYEINVQIEE